MTTYPLYDNGRVVGSTHDFGIALTHQRELWEKQQADAMVRQINQRALDRELNSRWQRGGTNQYIPGDDLVAEIGR
jgi:hypothetical protein